MKILSKLIMTAFATTALIPVISMAQDSKNQGYLVDSRNNIVMSATGLCWHDSDWTPARAVEPCDPTIRPAAVAVAAAPIAPRAAVPPPAALPPPEPVKPMPQKISYSSDAMFAFDQSVLSPDGQVMLNDFVRQLEGVTYEVILVTGHADRIGSTGYNQKLSERRANSVKAYLMTKDIPVNRIEATGKGETQPLTKDGECTGAKNAKLIACLQPDRRVDVEMQGTKPKTASR